MMTAEQLKGSILQLAMQGKLVEQRPKEGTGEELYAKITLEKKQLIKKGTVKKEKQIDPPLDDDFPYDIPGSWVWARFGDITYNRDSERIPLSVGQRAALKKTYDYYGASGVIDRVDQYLFDKPLLLIGEDGANLLNRSTPIAFIAKGRYWVNNHAHVLDMSKNLDMVFVSYYINSISLAKYVTGTAQPKMNQAKMNSIWVPIPPLAEQKRIVAKIEELIPFVEQYAATSTKLNTLNATFPEMMKKSILQEAVQGKLVPQDPNDEPASLLLKKIAEEKKRLIKEGKIKKQKPLPEITEDEIPFDIPDSWEWVRLGTVITDTEAGKSPQCKNRPAKNEEWGVIKTTAIQDGYFLKEENKVLPEGFEIKEAQIIHAEDLLITRAGPQNRTGITCIVEEEPKKLILSDKTVRLAYMKGLVNHKYLMYVIKSPAVQIFVSATKSGMAASQVNISQDKMKLFIIPLPPLEEQDRIVNALDRVLPELRSN